MPRRGHSSDSGPNGIRRQRGGREREERGKGKGKGGPSLEEKPDKLFGDAWEEPRQQTGLLLLSEHSPPGILWTYVLADDSRRSYSGYIRGLLPHDHCRAFFERIRSGTDWKQPENRVGELIPRKTGWMVTRGCGCTYRYGGLEVEPQEYPMWMLELMQATLPQCGLPQPHEWPNSCNLNLYEDGGMSVGWHADDESLFQGKFRDSRIISLSLGARRNFEVRLNWPEKEERSVWRIQLGDGDLLTMEGMLQKHFQHRVPREEVVQEPRINLTWRWVVKHTPRCPAGRCRV